MEIEKLKEQIMLNTRIQIMADIIEAIKKPQVGDWHDGMVSAFEIVKNIK